MLLAIGSAMTSRMCTASTCCPSRPSPRSFWSAISWSRSGRFSRPLSTTQTQVRYCSSIFLCSIVTLVTVPPPPLWHSLLPQQWYLNVAWFIFLPHFIIPRPGTTGYGFVSPTHYGTCIALSPALPPFVNSLLSVGFHARFILHGLPPEWNRGLASPYDCCTEPTVPLAGLPISILCHKPGTVLY